MSKMKHKIIAIILMMISTILFWVSISLFTLISSSEYSALAIGIPNYLVIESDWTHTNFKYINIIIMSLIFSSLLFASGYLWAKSTNKTSNQELERTVKTPVD